jgi:hypothetical protein
LDSFRRCGLIITGFREKVQGLPQQRQTPDFDNVVKQVPQVLRITFGLLDCLCGFTAPTLASFVATE